MPRWPVNVLLKLFAEPRVAIGGSAAMADAFLPIQGRASSIVIASAKARAHARAQARRRSLPSTSRRRLAS
jgi:hypothetical protein